MIFRLFLLAGLMGGGVAGGVEMPTNMTWEQARERARTLVAQMSLEEKVNYIEGGKKVNGMGAGATKEMKRLNIPPILMSDATSGLRIGGARDKADYPAREVPEQFRSTAYPGNIGLAATFNPEVMERVGAAIGREARYRGVHIMLGPSVDLYRLPLHGRNYEYTGEDPWLAARMIAAYVKGMQEQGVLATLKVLVANNTEFLRKDSNSKITERALREVWMRTFAETIQQEKVCAVMTAYNMVNGVHCAENRHLITEILRGELGFKGLVMTDWGSVWKLDTLLASGQDLVMPAFPKEIKQGLNDKTLDFSPHEKDLDRMCTDLLATFIYCGFLDRPQTLENIDWKAQDEVSLQAAREGVVLLKNEGGRLPWEPGKVKQILVTGPLARKTPELGIGSGHVFGWDRVDILDGMKAVYGAKKVKYAANPTEAELKSADRVLVAAGFLAGTEGENRDRPFDLMKSQVELIRRCAKANPNTAVTITAGGAVGMKDWQDGVKSVLHTMYLGQKCGLAIAETIAGTVNPSGKLPFTIERDYSEAYTCNPYPEWATKPTDVTVDEPGDAEMAAYEQYLDGEITFTEFELVYGKKTFENRKTAVGRMKEAKQDHYTVDYVEGIHLGYRWYDKHGKEVLYPFGHGLSYTQFEYKDFKVEAGGKGMTAKLTVTNAGKKKGGEVVQIYAGALAPKVERTAKQLCGFNKVFLEPGQSATVEIPLDAYAFRYWDESSGKWKDAPGEYDFSAGSSSRDLRLKLSAAVP